MRTISFDDFKEMRGTHGFIAALLAAFEESDVVGLVHNGELVGYALSAKRLQKLAAHEVAKHLVSEPPTSSHRD